MNKKQLVKDFFGQSVYDKLSIAKIERAEKKKNKDVFESRKNNVKFKDTHKGERCFILGNGPSLKDVVLSELSDEFVFSVNNFSQVENYKDAHTNVHLWMDLSFFGMREEQKYNEEVLMENFQKIADEGPICFVPYECSEYIIDKKLDKILNINYLQEVEALCEDMSIKIDISKPITGYSTVVQYAIVIALYMGFSKIYLLGCDTTNIISILNCAQNISNINMHAYENDDVDERYKELIEKWGMTNIFYDQYQLFLGYKLLAMESNKRGVILINCSTNTLINEIPRQKLSSVLEGR